MHQVRLVRIHVAAGVHHHVAQPGEHPRVAGGQDAAHHVGVAVDELGDRVQHHVGAERQRPLQVGAREGVVDHQQGAVLVRDRRRARDVGDQHRRVRRRLDVHEARGRTHRPAQVLEVRAVDERRLGAEPREVLLEQPAARPVDRGGAHHVRPLGEQRHVDGVDRAHPRAGRDGADATLEGGDGLLEGRNRGVADAGVDVALLGSCKKRRAVRCIAERERRTLVDGDVHGAGAVRMIGAVHERAVDAEVFRVHDDGPSRKRVRQERARSDCWINARAEEDREQRRTRERAGRAMALGAYADRRESSRAN